MQYVKYFNILGVNTTQIPCIELQGVPNTATEGAVGLLGINVLSAEHELYKCVEVNGNVYTWMPIKNGKDGVGIVKTELNDNSELVITLSDGTQTNLGCVRGQQGEKGEQADLTKIKEKNTGKHIGFWSGDTEAFENLEIKEENTWYLLEDDKTLEEIEGFLDEKDTQMGELETKVTELESRTKALEDITPVVEDELSDLKDKDIELNQSMSSLRNDVDTKLNIFDGTLINQGSEINGIKDGTISVGLAEQTEMSSIFGDSSPHVDDSGSVCYLPGNGLYSIWWKKPLDSGGYHTISFGIIPFRGDSLVYSPIVYDGYSAYRLVVTADGTAKIESNSITTLNERWSSSGAVNSTIGYYKFK